jgi:hypothetical protein
MIDLKKSLGLAAFGVTAFAAGAALTVPVSAQVRGDYGSDRNIVHVENRLAALIGQLDRDRRDYGGHRVNAIRLMQQADGELHAAIAYDRSH